jgi:tetratricopeptide (TPR) repeat protein
MKFPRSALILVLLLVTGLSVQAKDEWTRVQSKNFLLVGNAPEKDIRKVATRLEQFRESLRQILRTANFTSGIPTNVVVFKSDSSFREFKPKRADGKIDDFVAGYFQPGEDVNYIALATRADDAATYHTIFHEYVHFVVNTNFGKSEVPAWFNEGLAEYYSTFAIEDDQKVHVGMPIPRHIFRLRESPLMPLRKLFSVRNADLSETGDHSRSIFYAESWALVHYLLQNDKSDGLTTFLNDIMKNVPAERAFQDAFKINYEQMEGELKKYIGQERYFHSQLTFKNKLTFDADMTAAAIDEAASNAYLGDLLYHSNRDDDAEAYLIASLKLAPDASMANTSLGMVKMRQGKLDDARKYLEKGVAADPRNHVALFRYAYLLTREGRGELGLIHEFDAKTAAKMRHALRRAIAINPAFTESYEMLAFVNLVRNEELDDAVTLIRTALRYQPGNQRYSMRLAEVYSRQNKLAESEAIAKKIAETTDDQDLTARAARLINFLREKRRYDEQLAAYDHSRGAAERVNRVETAKVPTDDELRRRQSDANLRSLNAALRKPLAGEERFIGRVQRITCRPSSVAYTVKTSGNVFTLTSRDFNSLILKTFDGAASTVEVGCDANISQLEAVITFRSIPMRAGSRGELVALEFVPAGFRFMTDDEMRGGSVIIYPQP